jgi:putative glycosyltransferase
MISIVTSLYKSERTVAPFYARTLKALQELGESYEFIFVNDGSPDASASAVMELRAQDTQVRLVELSRNFGHHEAVLTGLQYAAGEWVFLLDSDLEEPPGELVRFYRELSADPELDVIYGYMPRRKGGPFERLSGRFFYQLLQLLSEIHIPQNALTMRLMRRPYVEAVLRYGEHHLFLGGLLQLAGFRQKGVPVQKTSKGFSSYTFGKRLKGMLNALLSFSDRPLVLIMLLGLVFSSLSFLVIIWLVVKRFILGHAVEGWASLMASLWFLGGLILFALGVIGLYIGKIFVQVKRRPRTVVRRTYL